MSKLTKNERDLMRALRGVLRVFDWFQGTYYEERQAAKKRARAVMSAIKKRAA